MERQSDRADSSISPRLAGGVRRGFAAQTGVFFHQLDRCPCNYPTQLSLTVPVMPPNVCCASNSGAENVATATTASSRKNGAERDRPEDIFTWPHSMKKDACATEKRFRRS